jgi:hypothetical protein
MGLAEHPHKKFRGKRRQVIQCGGVGLQELGEAFLQVLRNDALNEYKRGKRDPRDPYGAVEQTRHTAPYNSKPPLALPVDAARTKYEHMPGSVNTEIR